MEEQLQRKKRELAEQGVPIPPEKDVFRDVLKEHIETLRPSVLSPSPTSSEPPEKVYPPVPAPPAQAPQRPTVSIREEEVREKTVRQLVEKALTGTIEDAVRLAEKESPYYVDALHDRLVDEYYEKLLHARKLEQI